MLCSLRVGGVSGSAKPLMAGISPVTVSTDDTDNIDVTDDTDNTDDTDDTAGGYAPRDAAFRLECRHQQVAKLLRLVKEHPVA